MMQNKYERRVNDHKYTQHKMLWVGMYTGGLLNDEKRKALSYRTKAEERDRLKLEREEWK
jgi:hypothetical protein